MNRSSVRSIQGLSGDFWIYHLLSNNTSALIYALVDQLLFFPFTTPVSWFLPESKHHLLALFTPQLLNFHLGLSENRESLQFQCIMMHDQMLSTFPIKMALTIKVPTFSQVSSFLSARTRCLELFWRPWAWGSQSCKIGVTNNVHVLSPYKHIWIYCTGVNHR